MDVVDALLAQGQITEAQLTEAREAAQENGHAGRVDRALIELGHVEEDDLLRVAGEQLHIPVVDLTKAEVDRETLAAMPSRLVHQKTLFPVDRSNGTLRVATCDPYNLYALDEVRLATGLHVEPVLAPEYQLRALIKTHYGVGGDTLDKLIGDEDDGIETLDEGTGGEGASDDLLKMAQEASVIKLVNEIFLEAFNERASDIHIEPYENDLRVRYRIDGVLQDAKVPPTIRRFQAAIISRIKIMSHLNIAEKRLPQDGRIKLRVGGRQVDIRVSVIPMLFGEGVVMRVLDKSTVLYTLTDLGMADDTFAIFEDQIKRPHGIILVTGPTGSGKTTTLYAALSAIVSDTIKVLTVEDPVEYHLDGINQIQVNSKIDFSFARGLRAILRHDPDVVMIGEIRDRETAEAAIQAAMTGHLVLSTLHTNDASSSATRLVDMGVEPFLVTSTLNAAMAQRLVRTICSDCKEAYEPSEADRVTMPADFALEPGEQLYRGVGCRKCNQTGYRGRTGLFELMACTDEIREKVMAHAPAHEVQNVARSQGLRLLREDGWRRVRAGETTPEEVTRSTKV